MNKDELAGGARNIGGKVETAIGDAVGSSDWKVDGAVDQIAGGAQHAYGRAKAIVNDMVDSAPEVADAARDRLKSVSDRQALWAVVAGVAVLALAGLINARR